MKRRGWLIAIVTALFVLQAPICALACFETTQATQATQATEATSSFTNQACHEQNPASSPIEESSSQEDCGCHFTPQIVISQASDFAVTPDLSSAVLTQCPESIRSRLHSEPPAPYGVDLPAPDILLLKSTLIV